MTTRPEKIRERILASPAPRDIDWNEFTTMWESFADEVENESGDRLAVEMHGHRVVFRRPRDGSVDIEDVELSRRLLRTGPTKSEGSGHLLVVTVTTEDARFRDFDLNAHDVEVDTHEHEKNPDSRGHHLRTVERKTGRDDEHDLRRFFDDLAATLKKDYFERRFVLLGHGTGSSNATAQFNQYLQEHHPVVATYVIAEGKIDLPSATDADIENEAKKLAGQ
ncbi:hypothetical protein [Mobilicoccus massiliensis]|uniref:hypothetical protein n=1 Tax=Mobilicoccus massiliensis TaxID=1522310 RepID=UPI00058BF8D1|nr:hypothetical protein [Mobilicoccus massiliensis]